MRLHGGADDLAVGCGATLLTITCVQAEIGALRDDIAPALMRSPLSLEETVQRYVRPHLREVAINLCRQPVAEYLNRFEFRRCVCYPGPCKACHGLHVVVQPPAGRICSDLVKAMYAVTDGFSGKPHTLP